MYILHCKENEITYGQQFLLKLCDERKISEFWRENCAEKYSVTYMFCIATGKCRSASLMFINSLVKWVNPADWFYTIEEPRPAPLSPNVKLTNDIHQSVNVKKLKEMHSNKTLYKFCKEKQLDYKSFMHIVNGRNKMSYPRMMELKKIFNPLDWFILAEE